MTEVPARVVSKAEREIARKLRALLANAQPGEALPDGDELERLVFHLESFLIEVLGELHREWKYESFDDLFLKHALALSADEAELYGLCNFIEDQTLAPFHIRLQIAPNEDAVNWAECRAGRRVGQEMQRTPYEKLTTALAKLPPFDQVDWMYRVTFGEHRPIVKPTRLSLVVLKSHDLDRLVAFYRQLGIEFAAEQHGKGPVHFAAKLGEVVLEIYPLSKQQAVDTTTRIGFAVSQISEVVAKLEAAGVPVLAPPRISPWGTRAVVRDPDGRSVELLQPATMSETV